MPAWHFDFVAAPEEIALAVAVELAVLIDSAPIWIDSDNLDSSLGNLGVGMVVLDCPSCNLIVTVVEIYIVVGTDFQQSSDLKIHISNLDDFSTQDYTYWNMGPMFLCSDQ